MPEQPDDPTKLTQVKSEAQAALIVGALADQSIEAQTEGGLIAGFRAEAPGGVDILVHRRDLDRALAILRELNVT
jgi:hypothetical protein